ncbi:hypothetical protein ACRRTK_002308 [Alexandromys fortis]
MKRLGEAHNAGDLQQEVVSETSDWYKDSLSFMNRNFSEIAVFHTSENTPPAPLSPKLKEAGVYRLWLEWCAPTNPNPNDILTYVLEMEEPRSVQQLNPGNGGRVYFQVPKNTWLACSNNITKWVSSY